MTKHGHGEAKREGIKTNQTGTTRHENYNLSSKKFTGLINSILDSAKEKMYELEDTAKKKKKNLK